MQHRFKKCKHLTSDMHHCRQNLYPHIWMSNIDVIRGFFCVRSVFLSGKSWVILEEPGLLPPVPDMHKHPPPHPPELTQAIPDLQRQILSPTSGSIPWRGDNVDRSATVPLPGWCYSASLTSFILFCISGTKFIGRLLIDFSWSSECTPPPKMTHWPFNSACCRFHRIFDATTLKGRYFEICRT